MVVIFKRLFAQDGVCQGYTGMSLNILRTKNIILGRFPDTGTVETQCCGIMEMEVPRSCKSWNQAENVRTQKYRPSLWQRSALATDRDWWRDVSREDVFFSRAERSRPGHVGLTLISDWQLQLSITILSTCESLVIFSSAWKQKSGVNAKVFSDHFNCKTHKT